jgi:hypothetical protein
MLGIIASGGVVVQRRKGMFSELPIDEDIIFDNAAGFVDKWIGIAAMGAGSLFDRNLHSAMTLVPTPAPREASRCVTNGIPLGCPLFSPVGTVNFVQTLKACSLCGMLSHPW